MPVKAGALWQRCRQGRRSGQRLDLEEVIHNPERYRCSFGSHLGSEIIIKVTDVTR